MITIATVGWILFVMTAVLYLVGNKLNVRESQSLAIYSLAALVSDEFRTANLSGFKSVVKEAHAKSVSTDRIVYGLIAAVTNNAKRYHPFPVDSVSTLGLVIKFVENTNAAET